MDTKKSRTKDPTSNAKSDWWIAQKDNKMYLRELQWYIFPPISGPKDLLKDENQLKDRWQYARSHYRFNKRLVNKVLEYQNYMVTICSWEYTGKTCSECGSLHLNVGSRDVLKHPQCNQKSDRNFNPGRSIILINMTLLNVEHLLLDFLGILQKFRYE